MSRITILKLEELNALVIKKKLGDDFFATSEDSIVISIFNLAVLIKFMLFRGFISPRLLQGIVDEYVSSREH